MYDNRYDTDTEHVNGEGYINQTAIDEAHSCGAGIIGWCLMATFICVGLLVGWLIAVAIGGI